MRAMLGRVRMLVGVLLGRVPCEQDCACPRCGMEYYRRLMGCVVVCLACRMIYRMRG